MLGREEPSEFVAARWGEFDDFKAGDGALFETHGVAACPGEQVHEAMAHVGLMAYECQSVQRDALLERSCQSGGIHAGREFVDDPGGVFDGEFLAEDLGGLTATEQRAGPDLLDLCSQTGHALTRATHFDDALVGEMAHGIVVDVWRVLRHSGGMSDEIDEHFYILAPGRDESVQL